MISPRRHQGRPRLPCRKTHRIPCLYYRGLGLGPAQRGVPATAEVSGGGFCEGPEEGEVRVAVGARGDFADVFPCGGCGVVVDEATEDDWETD